jgi:hypothetical protein
MVIVCFRVPSHPTSSYDVTHCTWMSGLISCGFMIMLTLVVRLDCYVYCYLTSAKDINFSVKWKDELVHGLVPISRRQWSTFSSFARKDRGKLCKIAGFLIGKYIFMESGI